MSSLIRTATRVGLLAFPPDFRRQFGDEWARTVRDLTTHGGRRPVGVVLFLAIDVLSTAPRLRLEAIMPASRTALTWLAIVAAAFTLVMGPPLAAILLLLLVVVLAVQLRAGVRPIAAEVRGLVRQWPYFLGAAVGLFGLGLAALAIDGDDELSEAVWATWMLSWTAGVVVGVVGLALAAGRLATRDR